MSDMTVKERLLGAIRGKEIDRVPWSPFLAYYWEHLPPEITAQGQVRYMQQMGADPLLRGFHTLSNVSYENCEITTQQKGKQNFETIHTPVGDLTKVFTFSDTAQSWFLTGHPVQTEEDFKILQYMMEHAVITPNPTPFETEAARYGDEALFVPSIGIHSKTAFQSLVEHWCGTVDLTYALYDFPETVEECLAVMQEKDMQTVENALNTSAEIFNFFEDSSTTNISPAFFEKYTLPQIDAWGKRIHKEGKLLLHHACGHLKDLLPLIAKSEIDVLESISPPPTGNIAIADAVKYLPERIAIIGGIEPTFFKNSTMEELEAYASKLLSDMKDRRFVLANSDSCPPGVAYEKFELISQLVRR